MYETHKELKLRKFGGHVKLDEILNNNVRDSCLVFSHCTARIKEIPTHSKHTLQCLTCYEKSWVEELEKLAKSWCEKIEHDQSERDLDTNSIKTSLKHLIDNKLTTHEESFVKAFLERLKVIRAFHYENKLETCGDREFKKGLTDTTSTKSSLS